MLDACDQLVTSDLRGGCPGDWQGEGAGNTQFWWVQRVELLQVWSCCPQPGGSAQTNSQGWIAGKTVEPKIAGCRRDFRNINSGLECPNVSAIFSCKHLSSCTNFCRILPPVWITVCNHTLQPRIIGKLHLSSLTFYSSFSQPFIFQSTGNISLSAVLSSLAHSVFTRVLNFCKCDN